MPRKPQHAPLRVLINNRLVGLLAKHAGGAIAFRYDPVWLSAPNAFPVSLSLPLREDSYQGAPVSAVFENLLPDSDQLRHRVAEKVGAEGTDAYSLLSQIGRDCVGALQFIPVDKDIPLPTTAIRGEPISDEEIGRLLKNLVQAPLGLGPDEAFRISVAGAQEKTALLFYKGKWMKPHGTTPTTHIFKKQIGTLPNGVDLSNSVENEFYCLKLMGAFGMPVNDVKIAVFGGIKTLTIERFDRRWAKGRLLRLPQEDCCQALSVPPTKKCQNQGGPGMIEILKLLQGSDTPADDQKAFLKAQILFWLIGATDGHAKNFSLFLGPEGRFRLAPFYDVLTAQPSLDSRRIERKQMKLAMSIGNSRHYKLEEIHGRHFIQTAERAGTPTQLAQQALDEVKADAENAVQKLEEQLPKDFPKAIHASVKSALFARLKSI